MKVLITGANGQLATDLIKTAPKEVELIPLTRKELDITKKEQVENILKQYKPDVVINTAAFHKTDLCEEEVKKTFEVNTFAVKYFVDYCGEQDIIFLHIITDYVFDGRKGEIKEPYNEDDIPNPINIYGLSKYAGELIIKNYLQKFYILRVASLYGKAGASGKGGNFVYTILKKAKAKEPLRVVDDIIMSPTYTYDLAQEIWRILKESMPYGIYHVTNFGYCSWYEFAKKILEFAKLETDLKPVSHKEYKTKAKRPLWSPLCSKKGIKLRPWEEGLKAFLEEIMKK